MKKSLALAAIVGLVAVPSLVSAHSLVGSDDSKTQVHQAVRHRVAPVVATTTTTPTTTTDTSTDTTVTVPGQTDPVPTSTEGDVSGATISWADAIAQAQAVFPDKTIVKVELENEHGTVVYEFKFADGTRMKLDATTGAVLQNQTKTHSDNRENEHSRREFGHEQKEREKESESHHNRGSSSQSGSSDDSATSTDTSATVDN